MTRRRIIEGTWSCSSCQRQAIPGRERRCPACGSPREADGPESTFDFGPRTESGRSVREGVEDAGLVARAAAGQDWFCGHCGAGNAGDAERCRHCSAPASPDNRLLTPRQEGDAPDATDAGDEAREVPARAAAAPPRAPSRKGRVLLALLACGALLWWWGTRTRTDAGTVEAVRWTRVVHHERFTPEVREGWRDELQVRAAVMPVEGRGGEPGVMRVRECRREQRGTRSVPDGTERVCRTRSRKVQCGTDERCRRKDLGNGFAEEVCEDVPRYCSESYEECSNETRYRQVPVYGERCRYDTHAWRRLDSRTLSGQGEEAPRWPDVAVGPHDRVQREERYEVDVLRESGERHTVKPRGEAEFRAWRPRARVALTVNNFGQVTAASPAP
jgi:hypothetical protein